MSNTMGHTWESRVEGQRLENDSERVKTSATLKIYHAKLVSEGKPADYILTKTDFAAALNIPPNKVISKLSRLYKALSINDVLAGIELPNNYKG